MDLKFSPKEKFPARGHCIEMRGDWVTEKVHDAVRHVVNSNRMDCEYYQARQGFCVFFQSDLNHKWILLEFWVDDLAKTDDFIRLLEREIWLVLVRDFTKIRVNPYTMGYNDGKDSYGALHLIAQETGCPVDWGCSMTPITFKPENNLQSIEVQKLCETFDLKIKPWHK